MFDAEVKRIDAVTVGTPDHIHAVATAAAGLRPEVAGSLPPLLLPKCWS
jgi:hypothetical protein